MSGSMPTICRSGKKNQVTVSQSAAQTEAKNQSGPSTGRKPMPPEIILKILSYRRDSNSGLMTARLVNRQFNACASEILKKNADQRLESIALLNMSHQPGSKLWMGNSNEGGLDVAAPRFTTTSQLKAALRFPPEVHNENRSQVVTPFPTGVVVFSPYYGKERGVGLKRRLKKYSDLVGKFLDRFTDISSVVYFVHKKSSIMEWMGMLQQILKHPKLRNLFIYMRYGQVEANLNLLDQFREKVQAEVGSLNLDRLHIGEESDGRRPTIRRPNSLPPILLFAQCKEIMGPLKSLEFEWPRELDWDEEMRKNKEYIILLHKLEAQLGPDMFYLPNLQQLKIVFPDAKILKRFCNPGPTKLNAVSFVYDGSIVDSVPKRVDLGLCESLLGHHSQTLTSFRLEVTNGGWKMFLSIHSEDQNNWTNLDLSVKYPIMRNFSIYIESLMNHRWNLTIQDFLTKFPNLEEVIVLGDHYEILNKNQRESETALEVSKKAVRLMVCRLWKIVPASVTKISFPDYVGDLVVKRGEKLELNRMILRPKQN